MSTLLIIELEYFMKYNILDLELILVRTVYGLTESDWNRFRNRYNIETYNKRCFGPLIWIWETATCHEFRFHINIKISNDLLFILGIWSFYFLIEVQPTANSHFCLLTCCVSQMLLRAWIWMSARKTQRCVYIFMLSWGKTTCRMVSESISLFLT